MGASAHPEGGGLSGGGWARPAALALAAAAAGSAAWLLWRSQSRSRGPARVARLFIHPVKGCKPVEVSEVRLDGLGIVNDRRWAVLDMSKEVGDRVQTARAQPRLVLVEPTVAEPGAAVPLALAAPGMPPLRVPMPGSAAQRLEVALWAVPGLALDCGDEAADWLNKYLGESSLRLAFISEGPDVQGPVRTRDMCKQEAWNGGNEADSVYMAGTHVAFADSVHLTVMSEASLADLNRRLPRGAALTVERFRMNVLLAGARAYEEESWKSFSLGSCAWEVSRLCNRCLVTLVDPETGARGPQKGQPLELLRSFRLPEQLWKVDPRHGTAPILGTKACTAAREGVVRVGDVVSGALLRTEADRMY